MDEQKRKKILVVVFAGVIAIAGGRSLLGRIFFEPVRLAEAKRDAAAKSLEAMQKKEVDLRSARNHLDEWRDMSLPEDTLIAQRLYREWIENLAIKCGFTVQSVEPGAKSEQRGRYLTVSVDLKGETDLPGLSRFMYLFDQAKLLHSISLMKINSTGTQGNPRLEVALTAEGMSVFSSKTRSDLFSRTGLSKSISDSETSLQVQSAKAIAEEPPFLVQIGRELVRVTSVNGDLWTIERGTHGTKPTAHSEATVVELLPVLWDRRQKDFEQYSQFLKASPFAIPAPPRTWNPKLTGLSDRTIRPGEEVRVTLKADDINPELGAARFTLLESAEGMTLDPATGELVWKTADSLAAGKYSARIAMTQEKTPDAKVEAQMSVTVQIPNATPVVKLPESAIVVLGQPFEVTATATDDGPAEQLTFSMAAGSPEGLTIDPKSGVLKWTPAMSFKPGPYEAEVKVTDAGSEPQTASQKIRLDVQDDSAVLTILTGAVSKDDVRFAWFRNKGTGERMELRVGERIKVSEIDAEISAIESRSVVLMDSRGKWKLALGDSIRQRVLIEPAVAPAANTSSTDRSLEQATPTSAVKQ